TSSGGGGSRTSSARTSRSTTTVSGGGGSATGRAARSPARSTSRATSACSNVEVTHAAQDRERPARMVFPRDRLTRQRTTWLCPHAEIYCNSAPPTCYVPGRGGLRTHHLSRPTR